MLVDLVCLSICCLYSRRYSQKSALVESPIGQRNKHARNIFTVIKVFSTKVTVCCSLMLRHIVTKDIASCKDPLDPSVFFPRVAFVVMFFSMMHQSHHVMLTAVFSLTFTLCAVVFTLAFPHIFAHSFANIFSHSFAHSLAVSVSLPVSFAFSNVCGSRS